MRKKGKRGKNQKFSTRKEKFSTVFLTGKKVFIHREEHLGRYKKGLFILLLQLSTVEIKGTTPRAREVLQLSTSNFTISTYINKVIRIIFGLVGNLPLGIMGKREI